MFPESWKAAELSGRIAYVNGAFLVFIFFLHHLQRHDATDRTENNGECHFYQ